MSAHWHDAPTPESMADALDHVTWALDQMVSALDEGRYNFSEVHVRADLTYLRAEVLRAQRQRKGLDA